MDTILTTCLVLCVLGSVLIGTGCICDIIRGHKDWLERKEKWAERDRLWAEQDRQWEQQRREREAWWVEHDRRMEQLAIQLANLNIPPMTPRWAFNMNYEELHRGHITENKINWKEEGF